MDLFEKTFRLLPDTVIITDVYWYILDYNRTEPFEKIRKGASLKRYMADCRDIPAGRYEYGGKVYQRSTTPVYENGMHVGYVVYLADVTEKEKLVEQSLRKSAELEEMTREQAKANAELEEYVHQAEALCEYEEQVRIARSIHDDAGHVLTLLNTISQMCLQLRETDPAKYQSLLKEGLDICKDAEEKKQWDAHTCASLRELLETIRDTSAFPIDLIIVGEEPEIAASLYSVIEKVCREAYHNTLSHSMADRMLIEAHMDPDLLTLRISDNGSFHGTFEKGFGLSTMEENVKRSGGTLSFDVKEGKGFGITAEWRARE